MSRTLRRRAPCVHNISLQSRRTISSTPLRLFPETEEVKEDEDSIPPDSFLSTHSQIDAYLRAQNDEHLSRMKQHLKYLSRSADAINTVLPELIRRAAHFRPPKSESQSEKNSIPAYTVSAWRKSTTKVPSITQSLLDQIDRLMKNIEDLESEPYRADVTPSEREKLSKKILDWSHDDKEKELLYAEFQTSGMEARFIRGVEQMGNSVKAMLAARHEKAAEVAASMARKDPPSDNSVPVTKVEEQETHDIGTPNPFETVASAPVSSAKGVLEAQTKSLEQNPETEITTSPAPKDTTNAKADAKAVESTSEPKAAETKAEPKFRKLEDLQRLMDVAQKQN